MKKILLIEDNAEMRENTAEILQLASFNVLTAENGRVGVEIAQKEKPDLIICDIMMPALDGYGVLHLLSKNEETSTIPFIFLSAKADRGDVRKGMDMGADDYLTKPFDDIELLNAVESRLKKSEGLKKQFANSKEGIDEFLTQARGLEELKELSENSLVNFYKKKETIYQEGNYPKGVYLINRGKVKTYRSNDFGKELITCLYKEGDFFGFLPLIEDKKYQDTAQALEDSEICMIPKDDFMALMLKNSEVSKRFFQMISNDLEEKEQQLLKLAYNSVRKRVAEALSTLYDRYRRETDNEFTISISRDDLANLAGTATETTIRTLSDFREEGLVEIQGSRITIKNYERLSGMKN